MKINKTSLFLVPLFILTVSLLCGCLTAPERAFREIFGETIVNNNFEAFRNRLDPSSPDLEEWGRNFMLFDRLRWNALADAHLNPLYPAHYGVESDSFQVRFSQQNQPTSFSFTVVVSGRSPVRVQNDLLTGLINQNADGDSARIMRDIQGILVSDEEVGTEIHERFRTEIVCQLTVTDSSTDRVSPELPNRLLDAREHSVDLQWIEYLNSRSIPVFGVTLNDCRIRNIVFSKYALQMTDSLYVYYRSLMEEYSRQILEQNADLRPSTP